MKNSSKLALALLSAALLGAAPALAQPASGAQVTVSGAVARQSGGELTLSSGQIVYLNDGTVINPGSASLDMGPVTVTGYQNAEDGSINATEIDVATRKS